MSSTSQIHHNLKTYHVESAGYANPCGGGFVLAGRSRRSLQGASFSFSAVAQSGLKRWPVKPETAGSNPVSTVYAALQVANPGTERMKFARYSPCNVRKPWKVESDGCPTVLGGYGSNPNGSKAGSNPAKWNPPLRDGQCGILAEDCMFW